MPHDCYAIYIVKEWHYIIVQNCEFAMSLGGRSFLNAIQNSLSKVSARGRVASRIFHVSLPWRFPSIGTFSFQASHIQPTPYVELRGALSVIWANQYTVLLILILVKLLLYRANLSHSIDESYKTALIACELTNIAGREVQQAPVLMTAAANRLVVTTTNHVIDAALSEAISLANGIEKLLILGLEMLIGTYACMSLAVIDGATNVAINATESVISYANHSIIAAEKLINESVDDLADAFETLESLVTVVTDYFSGADNEITNVSSTVNHTFSSWYIPPDINSKLEALRSDVPTYDSVKSSVESLIDKPFSEITSRLNTTLKSGVLHINGSVLPSAISQPNHNVCSPEMIENEFQNFRRILDHVLTVIIVLSTLCLVGSLLLAWYREHRDWQWVSTCASDPLLNQSASEDGFNRFLFFINKTSSRSKWYIIAYFQRTFGISDTLKEVLAIWWFSYISQKNCITLVSLALAGFLVVSAQYIILDVLSRAIDKAKPALSSAMKSLALDFKSEAVKWASQANGVLNKTETNVNEDIFSWINTQSTSLNTTISTLMTNLNKSINSTFGSTPLESTLSSVVDCAIGSKVSEAEKALTWLSQLSVKIPLVEPSILSFNESLSDNVNSGSQAISKKVGSSLEDIVAFYRSTLKLQLLVSCAFMSAWIILVFLSLLYCLFIYHTADRQDLFMQNQSSFKGPGGNLQPEDGVLPPPPDKGFSLYQLNSSFARADSSLLPSPHVGRSEEHLVSLPLDPNNPPPFLLTDPMKSIFSASQPSPTTIRSERSIYPMAWKIGEEKKIVLTSEDHRMSAIAPLADQKNSKD